MAEYTNKTDKLLALFNKAFTGSHDIAYKDTGDDLRNDADNETTKNAKLAELLGKKVEAEEKWRRAQELEAIRHKNNLDRDKANNSARASQIELKTDTGPQGKIASTSALTQAGSFDSSHKLLNDLEGTLKGNSDSIGPIMGRLSSLNPYDTTGELIDSQTQMLTQEFGKALEGGKLSDQDYRKYLNMMPQRKNTPEVALGKLSQIRRLLQEKEAGFRDALVEGGYNIPQGIEKRYAPPVDPKANPGSDPMQRATQRIKGVVSPAAPSPSTNPFKEGDRQQKNGKWYIRQTNGKWRPEGT